MTGTSSTPHAAAIPSTSPEQSRKLLILYGTQTGTAMEVAERLAREGKRRHFATQVTGLDQFDRVRDRFAIHVR